MKKEKMLMCSIAIGGLLGVGIAKIVKSSIKNKPIETQEKVVDTTRESAKILFMLGAFTMIQLEMKQITKMCHVNFIGNILNMNEDIEVKIDLLNELKNKLK